MEFASCCELSESTPQRSTHRSRILIGSRAWKTASNLFNEKTSRHNPMRVQLMYLRINLASARPEDPVNTAEFVPAADGKPRRKSRIGSKRRAEVFLPPR